MKIRYLFTLLLLSLPAFVPVFATNAVYLAPAASGGNTGLDCADAKAGISYFNTSGNWSATPTGIQIGPDTTVHWCGGTYSASAGTSNYAVFQASGTSGHPITWVCDAAATFTAPYWGGYVINTSSHVVLNGANCTITASANGSGLANQQGFPADTGAIGCNSCTATDVTIENWTISNLYVHQCTGTSTFAAPCGTLNDTNGGPEWGAILIWVGSNVTIAFNTITNAHWGIVAYYGPLSSNSTNIQIHHNTISGMDHGVILGDQGSNSTITSSNCSSGIHDNDFSGTQSWDAVTSPGVYQFHHDGIHAWANNAPGSSYSGVCFYNNYFHGNWGYGPSGLMTSESLGNVNYYFNNVIGNLTGTTYCADGLLTHFTGTGVNGSNQVFVNNTIDPGTTPCSTGSGGTPNSGSDFGNTQATGTVFKNNLLLSNAQTYVHSDSGSIGSSDYNLYDTPAGSNPFYGTCGSGVSFSTWQGSCGFDAHGQNVNVTVNTNYSLPTGSSAIGAGTNLTSLGITALDTGAPQTFGVNGACGVGCATRPAVGVWDAGAYTFQASLCGPPNYLCSTNSTANPGTIASIFSATSPTATTCSGACQNATAYDTTLNPAGTDCITRISDGTTFPSGVSMGNLTFSGGDNDIMGSVNETYLGVTTGQVYILHMNTSGNCIQVVNTGTPAIHVAGPFGFSKVTDTRFYYLVNKVQLWQGDITSDTTWTQTELFDLTGATGPGPSQCPGVNWGTFGTPTSASIMGISQTDGRFAWAVGPGGQGTADIEFVWDRTLGCAVVNYATGNYWTFCLNSCSSSTPATGTLSTASGTCWGSQGSVGSGHGIHDSQMSGDGNYMLTALSITGTANVAWTQGSCAGITTEHNQQTIWTIGTATTQWAYADASLGVGGAQSGSHNSAGVTHYITPYFNGPNIRAFSNVVTFTQFAAPVVTADEHLGWPHPLNDDSYPWVGASDLVTVANGGVFAPQYMQNVVYAWFPTTAYPPGLLPRLFTHTFSCGDNASGSTCPNGGDQSYQFGAQQSIGTVTQKGNFFCWVSTMLQSLGNDNLGHPRADGFCVHLDGQISSSFALTVSVTGSGLVTSIPSGISCSPTCTNLFTSGTVVTLAATPSLGWVFSGWSGSGCSGIGTCNVTMSTNESVTATFTAIPPPSGLKVTVGTILTPGVILKP